MKWFISRFAEPSSYAGFAAALGAIYAGITGQMPASIAVAQGVAGVIAFVKPDATKTAPAAG